MTQKNLKRDVKINAKSLRTSIKKTASEKQLKKHAKSSQIDAKRAPGISRKIPEIAPEAPRSDPGAPLDTQRIPKGPPRHSKAAKTTSTKFSLDLKWLLDAKMLPKVVKNDTQNLNKIIEILKQSQVLDFYSILHRNLNVFAAARPTISLLFTAVSWVATFLAKFGN